MNSKEQIFDELKSILKETFEIDPDTVSLDSNVATDLDLDSIDAIDMVAQVQRNLNCRLSAQDFKSVKTIGDIVEVISSKISDK